MCKLCKPNWHVLFLQNFATYFYFVSYLCLIAMQRNSAGHWPITHPLEVSVLGCVLGSSLLCVTAYNLGPCSMASRWLVAVLDVACCMILSLHLKAGSLLNKPSSRQSTQMGGLGRAPRLHCRFYFRHHSLCRKPDPRQMKREGWSLVCCDLTRRLNAIELIFWKFGRGSLLTELRTTPWAVKVMVSRHFLCWEASLVQQC